MKKNVKYIGSAIAVALLAAGSPVIIPMLVPTANIEVEAGNISNPNMSADEMIQNFFGQFNDRYVSSPKTVSDMLKSLKGEGSYDKQEYFYFNKNAPVKIFDVQNDGYLTMLKDANHPLSRNYFETPSGSDYYYRDILGYVSISSAGQTLTIDKPDDLTTIGDGINNAIGIPNQDGDTEAPKVAFPLTVTIHLSESNDKADGPYANPSVPTPVTKTFTVNLSEFDITKSKTEPSVNVDTSIDDNQLTSGNNYLTILDNYTGDSNFKDSQSSAGKAIYGKVLFTDEKSAKDYAADSKFDPTSTKGGNTTANQFAGGKILEPGTYFQTITYDLKGADTAIGYMLSGEGDPLMQNAKVEPYNTYINKVKANNGSDYVYNKDAKTITVVRPINVGATISPKLTIPVTNVGSTTSVKTDDNSLTNGQDTVGTQNITTDGNYYTDPTATTKATSDEISGGNFLKAGKYYRKLVFTLANAKTGDYSVSGDVDADRTDTTVTYIQEVDVNDVVNATIATPTVNAKSSINADDATSGNSLKADDGSPIKVNSVTFGNDYYVDGSLPKDVLDGSANKASNVVDSNGNFAKAGTYFRTVIFHLDTVNAITFDAPGYNASVDPENKTVTYVQEINIKAPNATPKKNIVKVNANATSDDPALKTPDSSDDLLGGDTDPQTSIVDKTLNTSTTTNGVEFGTTYYTDPQLLNVVADGKLSSSTVTYYRAIIYHLITGAMDANHFSGSVSSSAENNTVTYAQEIDVIAKKAAKVSVTDPITVGLGATSADDKEKLTNTSADVLQDSAGITLAGTTVTLGTEYYKTAAAALSGDTTKTTDLSQAGDEHYRTVILTPSEAVASGYDFSQLAKDKEGKVSVNKAGVVTYAQEVDVAANSATADIKGITTTVGTSTDNSSLNDANDSDITVGTEDNKSSIVSGIQFGNTYYDTEKDALAGLDGSKDIKNGKFAVVSGKTYYRRIAFTLKDGGLLSNTLSDTNHILDSKDDNTVIYAQPVTVDKSTATASIAGTTSTITVSSESSVNSEQSNEKNDVTGIGTDGNSGSLVAGYVQFGADYYSTDNNSIDTVLNGTPTATDGVVSGDNYIKSGTYYRKVTVPLKEGATDSNNFDPKTAKLSADGKSVTYVQKITIETNSATVNATNPISAKAGESSTSLPAVDGYTLDVNGESIKPKVGTDNKIYKTFNGKALSDEITDGKFPSAGKYYREITFTPTDASEYTFADPNVISNEKGVVTYVQTINVSANAAKVTVGTAKANVGDPITKLPSADGYTLNNDDTDSKVIPSTPTAGTTIYKNFDTKTKQFSEPVTSFDSVGTYYREITFKTADAAQYSFADLNVISNKDGVITYAQPISVGQESGAQVSQAVTDTKSVKVNISGEDSALSSKDGYSLTDASGKKTLIDAPTDADGISFSLEYYTLENGVLKPVLSADAHDYTISKKGIYYRKVIFKVSADTIANYDFSTINGTPDKTNSTISFIQKIDASTNPATANISSPSVSYNTSADSSSLKNPAGVSLKDGNDDKAINSGNPMFSGIFSSKDAAKNAISDTGDVNGNLTAGTYYQRVTFPLSDNDGSAYDFGDGVVSKDGKSVTYVRTITVKAQTHSGGGSSSNNNGTSTGDEDEWTYYKDPGVVTTKNGQPSYSMNNLANDTIRNRALGRDSAWITDQYRTNRAGVKQYRVATGEWIDSHDVYFAETPTNNNNNDDEWTYYKNPGVVTTKTDQGYYDMNHKDDSAVNNRALEENTAWITDQYRTNREGVKQYRVASDEWVDSHDVIFAPTGQETTVLTGIRTVKGIVNVDETKAYYSLYNVQDNLVKSRALAEKTSWATDRIAKDPEGNTYYRVATNEWIKQEKGVYYSDSAWYK